MTDVPSNQHPCCAPSDAVSSTAEPRRPGRAGASAWSFADQAAVSLGNFATNILLARAMPPREFGVFGLIFGILLFVNNLHGSLITYPLSVHGATGDDDELRRLTWLALLLTFLLALPIALVFQTAAWALKMGRLAPWVLAALVFWQIQETLRRALMAHMHHRRAIWGDAVSYLGQAACIACLIHSGHLSLPAIFAAIALTSAAASLIQLAQLRIHTFSPRGIVVRARDSWNLGRWTALSNFVGVANIQAVPWALAAFHGAAEAGKLVALGNIVGVTHPAVFSVGNLIVPATARAKITAGVRSAWHIAAAYGAMGALLVVPYYLALGLRPEFALRHFYGAGSSYLALSTPLRLFATAYFLAYVCMVMTALLNGLSRSRSTLLVQLASVAATLLVTLPLAMLGGVKWSLAGACVSTLAGVITAGLLLRRSAGSCEGERFVTEGAAMLAAAA